MVRTHCAFYLFFSFVLSFSLFACVLMHDVVWAAYHQHTTVLLKNFNLRWIYRGLPWIEHDFSRVYTYVGGRGRIHYICGYGSMLQVSRSTQKLLTLPKVSEQTIQVENHYFQHPLYEAFYVSIK